MEIAPRSPLSELRGPLLKLEIRLERSPCRVPAPQLRLLDEASRRQVGREACAARKDQGYYNQGLHSAWPFRSSCSPRCRSGLSAHHEPFSYIGHHLRPVSLPEELNKALRSNAPLSVITSCTELFIVDKRISGHRGTRNKTIYSPEYPNSRTAAAQSSFLR